MEQNTNQIVSFLTHHVRTSLSSMLGFVEALYDSQQSTKEKFAHLGKIRTTIENTARTLEDFQHLAAMDRGSLSLRSSQFSLEEELNETVLLLKSLARKRQLNLEMHVVGKVPTEVLSDALRLRQLLTHLVSLVLEQTPQGTIRITLSLTSTEPNRLSFLVDSTGTNLSEDMAEEVASPAKPATEFSLPSTHGHTAITISLIKALSHSLGGELKLQKSTLGKGHALSVSIDPGPLNPLHLTDKLLTRPIEDSRDVKPITVPNFSEKSILLIEDDKDISDLLTHFLRKTGASVENAATGEEGIQLAKSGNFDLIFLDLQLPKINGLEACSKIRSNGISSPIVALTANTSLETKRKCFQVGFNLYMTKPISIESLFQLIPNISP